MKTKQVATLRDIIYLVELPVVIYRKSHSDPFDSYYMKVSYSEDDDSIDDIDDDVMDSELRSIVYDSYEDNCMKIVVGD